MGGEALTLKPDAFVITARDAYEYVSFVETDCGTEGGAVLKRKAAVYRRYWQQGGEQAELGVFPHVVFLVPDARRLRAVVTALGSVPDMAELASVRLITDGVAALSGLNATEEQRILIEVKEEKDGETERIS